jgi:serine/threonine protein kinase/lipopolysaccharide biosynthesis regulator YciM
MSVECPKCHSNNPDDTIYCGKCATPLRSSEEIPPPTETLEAPREELTTGSTFAGRYQIIEEIGKGGMGKVYKAQDKKIKETIALKLIKPEIASDKKTIERFGNEMKFARKVSHRNVCRMYDLGEEKGSHFITMEYVSGQDLKGFIRQSGQMAIGTSISVAKQVCEGLSEAHKTGVIHRDLKPSNIMIDREGNVRIMDFGIARSLEAKGITGAGVMIGTPEYMSPEQVEGKETDQRSDLYSLGVILYEMVTGQVPFQGDTPFTIGVKHKSETPKDPKELNSQISGDLSTVILKCLEKDKDKRYQSAGEVRSELTNIEEGIPTTERVIPERKPLTSREITVTFGLRKLFIPALVLVAVIIVGLVIWQPWSQEGVVPILSGKPSLAVMYFKNNTGDEGLDHWRAMISDLFIADLTQSKYIAVLSGERLFKILSDLNQQEAKDYSSDVLKQVATQGEVNHILVGNYAKAGETIRINVTLQEVLTEKILASEGVEGKGEESIFSMVDDLTRRIKSNFKLSQEQITSDIDREVGKITTSSSEAYKYYSEGRKYQGKGKYREGIQFMERAVAIDPEFAMAFRGIATCYQNLRLYGERNKYMKKALELADRLSDRELYLIQGDSYRGSEKTYDKAIEAYTKLLELYPEDWTGNNNLGILYAAIEERDKAIERYKTAIRGKDPFIVAYTNLASSYRAKGLYDKAKETLEYYINNISDHAAMHRSLSQNYIHLGKLDLALAEAEKAFILNPTHYINFRRKGDIYLYKGNLIKAEEEYQTLLKSREPAGQGWGRVRLSQLYELQGRFKKSMSICRQGIEWAKELGDYGWESGFHFGLGSAYLASGNPEETLKQCDEAWRIAGKVDILVRQRQALYLKGNALIEMKLMDEAQETADELKEMVEKDMNKKRIRRYYHLIGRIELEKENYTKAIQYFKEALDLESFGPLTRNAKVIDSLAQAFYKSEDLEKSREEYERIISLTTGRLSDGDIYAKSFYMLGKIYEQQGDTAKAIEHYEKFLDLWKDADPGIAEVEDAREAKLMD